MGENSTERQYNVWSTISFGGRYPQPLYRLYQPVTSTHPLRACATASERIQAAFGHTYVHVHSVEPAS